MAKLIKTNYDFEQNQIMSFVVHAVGSDPSTPADGQMWYRTDTDTLHIRANGVTEAVSTSAGGISNVVEDTTPQLGGNLDVTTFSLTDGATKVLLGFVGDVGSAVNFVQIENEITGSGPILRSTGADVNVDFEIQTKGSGVVNIAADLTITGTVDGVDIAAEETRLANTSGTNTGDEAAASVTVVGVVELATIAEVDTGTDATRAVTPDSLQGSALQTKVDAISGSNTGDEAAASETVSGVAELATQVETDAGTDDLRIVTPLKLDTLNPTGMSWFIDEDTMATDSDVRVPSQQSVKAYVDSSTTSAMTHKGGYNATTDTPALDTGSPSITIGDTYTVTVAGTFFTEAVEVGDRLIADVTSVDVGVLADWTIVQANIDAASTTVPGFVELLTIAELDTGTDTTRAATAAAIEGSARSIKLDLIEAVADVTDAANVNTALSGATITAATVATGDKVLIQDVDDADNLKTVTAQAIADLGAGTIAKYAVDCAALATTTVTHNLGTLDITVQVWDSTAGASDGELVDAEIDKTSTNACTVTITPTPAAGDFRIVVIG